MSFTKVHQSAGSFTLKLRDDLPYSISQELTLVDAGFSHLCVLPVRLPYDELDWATLKALSIYTGVVRKRRNRTELSGAHATIWLGDEDKKGNIEASLGLGTQTFEWWVDALRKTSAGTGTPHLYLGSVEALGGSHTALYYWNSDLISRRDQLAEVCEHFSAEFRVNDDLTLDAGTASYLYGSTPTVLLTPTWEGRDSGLSSIRCTFVPVEDVEDWTSDVMYEYSGGGAKASGTKSYLNGLGTDALWVRRLDLDASKSSTDNAAIAAQQLSRFQTIRNALDVSSDSDAVTLYVNPGDRVYSWDPDRDVLDMTATPVYFRGELVWPLTLTVQSVTMNASPGLGVYLRRGDGEIFDLSQWYEPETPGARLEVGDRPQSLRAAMRARGVLDRL